MRRRLHLFEFTDLRWLPEGLRSCLMRYLRVMHRGIKAEKIIASLIAPALRLSGQASIIDLCSGGGGPIPDLARELRDAHGLPVEITLTDLYPSAVAAAEINADPTNRVRYLTEPVNAAAVPPALAGMRTMVAGFHHMPPPVAGAILADAFRQRQPICIFEVTEHRPLAWLMTPAFIVQVLLLTPLIRPLTLRQIFFTYIVPLVPILIAWDGLVSCLRTYSEAELRELIAELTASDYQWKIGAVRVPWVPMSLPYLLGHPTSSDDPRLPQAT
jgi:hypothetical protein